MPWGYVKLFTKSNIKKKYYWRRYGLLPRMSRLEWAYCTYARLHGNGSYFLPFFWFLEFTKIYVSAIISSQAICFLASFTMVLQKKMQGTKNGIPKSWEDKLIDCPLSLKMSIFCKNGPEKWTLWPKISVFVSSHNTSMLKEYKVYQNLFIL